MRPTWQGTYRLAAQKRERLLLWGSCTPYMTYLSARYCVEAYNSRLQPTPHASYHTSGARTDQTTCQGPSLPRPWQLVPAAERKPKLGLGRIIPLRNPCHAFLVLTSWGCMDDASVLIGRSHGPLAALEVNMVFCSCGGSWHFQILAT